MKHPLNKVFRGTRCR